MTPEVALMVEQYITIRDAKEAAEKALDDELADVKAAMKVLESKLLAAMDELGSVDSIRCPAGTVYRSRKDSATVQERSVFIDWVKSHEEWDALDVKANKTFVRDQAQKGVEIPGVKFSSIYTVGVRRS